MHYLISGAVHMQETKNCVLPFYKNLLQLLTKVLNFQFPSVKMLQDCLKICSKDIKVCKKEALLSDLSHVFFLFENCANM